MASVLRSIVEILKRKRRMSESKGREDRPSVAHRRNVEIKARLAEGMVPRDDDPRLGEFRHTIRQVDTYFCVSPSSGRLKLRTEAILGKAEPATLIHYRRQDFVGPKLSDIDMCTVADPDAFRQIMSSTYGISGTVIKDRRLYFRDGTIRIHLDDVFGIGRFLEVEVVLADDEDEASGRNKALRIMKDFGLGSKDLIRGSYVDLLKVGSIL